MGKLVKIYKHNGKYVKTESDSQSVNTNSTSKEEEMSVLSGDTIITSKSHINTSQDNHLQQELSNQTDDIKEIDNKTPDTFQEHLGQYINKNINEKNDDNNTRVDKSKSISNLTNEVSDEKKQSREKKLEVYEQYAVDQGFKNIPKNLSNALYSWTKANRPVVNAQQWNNRITICRSCSYWFEDLAGGFAKCKKCGCGSGKLLLTQSSCPLNPPKWSSV